MFGSLGNHAAGAEILEAAEYLTRRRERSRQVLTVALDAEAARLVREWQEEFGGEECDIVSGTIVDDLTAALRDFRSDREEGRRLGFCEHPEFIREEVRQARLRRLAALK